MIMLVAVVALSGADGRWQGFSGDESEQFADRTIKVAGGLELARLHEGHRAARRARAARVVELDTEWSAARVTECRVFYVLLL